MYKNHGDMIDHELNQPVTKRLTSEHYAVTALHMGMFPKLNLDF